MEKGGEEPVSTWGISTPRIWGINLMAELDGWGEILKPVDQQDHFSKIRLTHIHIRSTLSLNKYCSDASEQFGLQMKGRRGKRSPLVP